jgi:hypothetical protein
MTMGPLPCPGCGKALIRIVSSYQQIYIWNEQDDFYNRKDNGDYTVFKCGSCGGEIGGGYFEQIDDRRWGIVPEVSDRH